MLDGDNTVGYRCLVTCMVVYEDKKKDKGYDAYWDEHPHNRMLRQQMYREELKRLQDAGVENAEEMAMAIVKSHEWPPENEL